jgi:FlaA1/EpsC-like NDP-sugar epimerase
MQYLAVIYSVFVIYHLYHWVMWHLARPDFTGKTVLITGASFGIGEELAK